MPDFTPDDIDIDPSEFIDACSSREIERLIEILAEDGHIKSDSILGKGVHKANTNDQIFLESLERLTNCRDLLSVEEEEMIVKLADKFKYIR